MSLVNQLIGKFYRIVLMRLYSDATVILLELKVRRKPSGVVRIENVTEENVEDVLSFQSVQQVNTFKKFLTLKHQGYYAYLQNVCIHRSWVVIGPATILLHKFYGIKLAGNEVFIQYCETAPSARGKNIFTEVLCHIGEVYQQKRILISVDSKNVSSLRSMTKAGFVEVYRKRIRVFAGFRKMD